MLISRLVVAICLIGYVFSHNLHPLKSKFISTENASFSAKDNLQSIYSDDFFSVSRKTFFNISNINDLFLIEQENSNDTLEIRIQRNPNLYSHSVIEIKDPKAKDLDLSQRIFLRMFLHPNNTASLDNLAAPSFSGREAMEIVRKLKELTNSSIVFLIDESVQLPTNSNCTKCALTSLRQMSVLKSGQSWYEKQGAFSNPQIIYQFFELHLKEKYLAALDEDRTFGVETFWDYDKFQKYYFANIDMSSVSSEAYNKASSFLHKIPIEKIQQTFSELAEHPKAQENKVILDSALKLISPRSLDTKTLGEVIFCLEKVNNSNMSEDDPAHKIFHDFRDTFVSHRNSFFLPLGLSAIKKRDLSPIAIATMIQILGEIPILNVSQGEFHKSQSSIYYDLLFGNINDMKNLHNLYDNYLVKCSDGALEDCTSPVSAKIIANSTEIQRRMWREYNCDRGVDNYIDALLPALEWFGSLTISDFKQINPWFFEYNQHMLPTTLRELSEDLTIKQLFSKLVETTSKEKAQKFMENMILCSKKSFSDAIIKLIERYQSKPEDFSPREVYMLWVLSKLVVDQYSIFAL